MQPTIQNQDQSQGGEYVDVDKIIATMKVPPNLKSIYDKTVLSGLRIMFSKDSFSMFEDQLNKPGNLAQKMSEGIVGLMYMLWDQSNKTLPPQIMIPVGVTLTLKAFDFLQKSKDPEATKQVLGDAVDGTMQGIMRAFGAKEGDMEKVLDKMKTKVDQEFTAPAPTGAAPTAPQPAAGGLIDNGGGNGA